MMMSFTSLTSLALAATVGSSPANTAPSVPAFLTPRVVVADSATAVTDEQLTHYIAVKKALSAFWPAHKDLLKTAQASSHSPEIQIGQQKMKIGVFDYPALVKQDTALAAIFTANKFAPEQFEPTQVAVFQAVGAIVISTASNAALPANTTVLGKNVELVKPHQDELKAVGIALQANGGGGGGGMGGGNDDLNP